MRDAPRCGMLALAAWLAGAPLFAQQSHAKQPLQTTATTPRQPAGQSAADGQAASPAAGSQAGAGQWEQTTARPLPGEGVVAQAAVGPQLIAAQPEAEGQAGARQWEQTTASPPPGELVVAQAAVGQQMTTPAAAQSAAGNQPEPQQSAQTMATAPPRELVAQVAAEQPAAAQAPGQSAAAGQAEAQPAAQAAEATQQAPTAEAPAPPVKEGQSSGTLDFGYRWVLGQGGSQDIYRSLVNLGEGPKLFGADLSLRRPNGRLYNRLDVHASSWGGDPYNTARIDAARTGLYDFRFDYRNIKYFNAIPSFGNPLLTSGVLFSQRSLDTSNRLIDTELDLLPGGHFSPYLAYYHSSNFGRGVTTFVDDNINEFPVTTELRDATDSYRGGVHVNFDKFHITLEQGGTTFKDDQQVGFSGTNYGNRKVPFLGQTILLNDLSQAYGARGNGIFERGVVQGSPASWLNFTGQFLYSKPSIDVNYLQQNSGNFVLLNTLQIYTGQLDRSIGEANRPHSSGSWSTEIRPFKRVRIIDTWYTDRFHIAAGSFLAETLTAASGAINTTANASDRLVLNYNQHEVDAIVDVTSFLTLRGGHRYEWGDATTRTPITLDLQGPQQASLGRQIALAGAALRVHSNLDFNVDFEASAADRTFFRTDLANYERARLRGRYHLAKSLSLTGSFSILNNQNPANGVNLDFQSRQTSLALVWTPNDAKRWSLLLDYTRGTVRSSIPYLVPQDRTTAVSIYRDNGHYGGAAVDLRLWGQARLNVGGNFALDAGSRPTRYFQPDMRAIVPLYKKISWTAEWRWFGFDERLFGFENFHAHLFSTGLRIGM